MASTEVYTATTAPNPKSSCFMVPSEHLDKIRFGLKIVQVLLSFLAFILEEMVNSCISCSVLYFFEFVSCTAFLFTLLLLVLLATKLHTKVGINCWAKLDFGYTAAIGGFLLLSSIIFISDNSGSALEIFAAVLGILASVAFAGDIIYFWRTRGIPFKEGGRPANVNGGPVPVATETEKLNTEANGV
ncbi:CKLF-like MARVEL transmembrane domain-containing protein 6 [Leuresthes tenuis]|uniref:CKLF-like MARVEL transmembrane domain-containing protein 6 n=1 Tax=Leuresthes tenuis TaxID=355514 RepID=UPI003B50E61A